MLTPKVQLMAGENIYPARFVTLSTSNPFTGLQSKAGDHVFGISAEGGQVPPVGGYTDATSVLCAPTGYVLPYYNETEECYIEVGEPCATGALLKPDANGRGVNVTSTSDTFGAIALESATASQQRIRCRVWISRQTYLGSGS